jgi:hypothetical protein
MMLCEEAAERVYARRREGFLGPAEWSNGHLRQAYENVFEVCVRIEALYSDDITGIFIFILDNDS